MSKFFDRRLLAEAQAHRTGLTLTIGLGALGGAGLLSAALIVGRRRDAGVG